MTEYSKKELDLIKSIAPDYISILNNISPPQLYQMMVEKVFCENLTGPHVESLRRCANALRKCSIYRMTKEWDELIQLDHE